MMRLNPASVYYNEAETRQKNMTLNSAPSTGPGPTQPQSVLREQSPPTSHDDQIVLYDDSQTHSGGYRLGNEAGLVKIPSVPPPPPRSSTTKLTTQIITEHRTCASYAFEPPSGFEVSRARVPPGQVLQPQQKTSGTGTSPYKSSSSLNRPPENQQESKSGIDDQYIPQVLRHCHPPPAQWQPLDGGRRGASLPSSPRSQRYGTPVSHDYPDQAGSPTSVSSYGHVSRSERGPHGTQGSRTLSPSPTRSSLTGGLRRSKSMPKYQMVIYFAPEIIREPASTSNTSSSGHIQRGESGDEDSGHPTDDNNTSGNTTTAAAPTAASTTNAARQMAQYRQLITEMRAQNFDVIRFATYRTACKLRFIQKKTNLYLVDIWNVIEAFRENGLNSLEPQSEVNTARLESLLNSIFYQLNKRLPTTSQIDADESVSILSHWLSNAYDPEKHGRIRVLSIKVSLATLCAGKLMDKLRYIFTQVSDTNGFLLKNKFEEYLREVLNLPTAIFEGPSFGFNETAARACFDGKSKVTVNDFLDTLMSDPGPQCLMWLPILHRMAQVENVFHPVQCEGCHRESFMGFRYKCQRCYNYHLCQDCFWRGRTSGNHTNDHEMKEYSSYKSPAKQLSHSLRKSFRCVPAKGNHRLPQFPDTPEKTIDLSHIVPPTPVPVHNGFHETSRAHSIDMSSLDSSSATKSPSKMCGSLDRDASRIDDEHRLIARYAARLAADANDAARSPTELNFNLDSNRAQRELIAQLEAKNKEILREIQRLRVEQEQQAKTTKETQQRNPTLLAELRILRQRRDELEARMSALQESRRELMTQLEGLMKLLKTHGSPRSTPNSSPRSRSAHSPPIQAIRGSAPATHSVNSPADALLGTSGDVRQAFGQHPPASSTSSVRSLRNDLLVAADSVTNAMSSLVKELNSEASGSSEEEGDDIEGSNFRGSGRGDDMTLEELAAWREEMQARLRQESDFISQLRARRPRSQRHNGSAANSDSEHYVATDDEDTYARAEDERYLTHEDADSYVKTDDDSYMRTDEEDAELYDHHPKALIHGRYMTDEESYLETDQESYIRTDDEEGGNTEWEETMRRWVNR